MKDWAHIKEVDQVRVHRPFGVASRPTRLQRILNHPLAGYVLQLIGLIAIAIGLYAGLRRNRYDITSKGWIIDHDTGIFQKFFSTARKIISLENQFHPYFIGVKSTF